MNPVITHSGFLWWLETDNGSLAEIWLVRFTIQFSVGFLLIFFCRFAPFGYLHFLHFLLKLHRSNFISSIWRDSNPRPLDRESSLLNTRPRLLAQFSVCYFIANCNPLLRCWTILIQRQNVFDQKVDMTFSSRNMIPMGHVFKTIILYLITYFFKYIDYIWTFFQIFFNDH